ncbi:Leucine rich repeat-containing protein, partial [Ruminococcus sp. YRD2003]|uniref:leucine-rich repeat protein n=1 Tax=Ruminococcus sp. YRD2003 TaxID=1452313 RepID=UPI0008C9F8BE
MNKLKRRILAGTAAAAMLLWNFADLPQGALGSAVLSAKAAVVSAPALTGTAKTAEPSMTPFEKDTFIKTLWKNFTVYESETVEKYNSGTLVISYHGYEIRWYKGENGEPFIPYPVTTIRTENGVTYVDNYEVVSIRNAFAGNKKIKKLMLPASVEKISDEDFKDCENLTSVSFDRRSLIINEDNEAESKFYIKNPALSSIGTNAFKDCNKLESFEFGVLSNLRSIGLSAFSGCEALRSVEFDYDNTGIDLSRDAFSECKALKSVVFPKSIDHISENCFRYCNALETVDFGKVKAIYNQAFRDCTSLKLNALPEVEELKYGAFYNCPKAEFTELPSTLKKIEPSVFSGSGIKGSITIPAGTEFEPTAFVNCPNLKYLELEDMTGGFVSLNGIVYRKFSDDNFTVAVCPQGIDSIYVGNIPAILGAKHIESFAFSGTDLRYPVIDGKYIKKIDSSAFEGAKINRLTITNSSDDGVPIELSSCVFRGAEIDELVIDTDITSHYDGVGEIFKNAHIGTVTITDKVTKIPNDLFGYNSSSTFRDDEEIAAGYPTIDKLIFNASKVTDGVSPCTFPGVVSAEFGDNITEIPGRMFDTPIGSSKLTSVTIPEGVRIINWGAFYGCEGLTEIELPDSLEYISGEAFRGTNIKSVYVPGNVTHISMFAFLDMPQLKWVALPNGLQNYYLGDTGIGFKSTGSEIYNIAPSDNKVIVYGDSIAENYVTKYSGNDEFVAVPDLNEEITTDFINYSFADPDKVEGGTEYCMYYMVGEPLTPALTSLFDKPLSADELNKYNVSYSNNVELGEALVTISTRDPKLGVGIGHAAFAVVDADCEMNENHAWGGWLSDDTNCGRKVRYCLNCNTKEEALDPDAHDWDMDKITAITPATCTEDGTGTVKCKNCIQTKEVVIPATGHTWKVKANGEYLYHTELPDFGKDGYTCRKCKDCGAEDEHFNIVPGYTLVPENVQITDITSDGAVVSWDTVNARGVKLILKDGDDNELVHEIIPADTTSYTFTELAAGKNYKLCLNTYYYKSQGASKPMRVFSEETYESSFVTPLPAIENLTISEDDIKATSVKLSWDMPAGVDSVDVFGLLGDAPVDNLAELSEKVDDSTLMTRIHPAFGDTGMTFINTTENEITIDGLYPAEDYTFYVMPHSENAALETVSVSNAYATTKVMKVQNFNATDVTPVSFNTSWDAMPEGYGVCIRVYKNIPELNGYNINSVINIADEYKDEFEKNINSYIEDGMPDKLAVEKALKDVREYFSEKYDETFAEIAAAYYDSGNIIHREDKLISVPGELSMAVEKLEPDTLYTLIVKPCKYDGAICNENCCSQLQVRTLSAKVENLRASDIQEKQFTLTWDYFPTKPESHIMTFKNVPDITGLDILPAIAEATGMMNDGKTEKEIIAAVTEKYGETIGSAISAMRDANNMIPEKNWEVNAEDPTHATLSGLEADNLYTVFIQPGFYDQNVASDNTTILQVRTKKAVEFYDLWVNGDDGIQVSSDNCQDILGNGKKELVYDPAAKTLSINGDVDLEESIFSRIEGLTIDVKKDSTLTRTKDENAPLLIMCGATTITGSGKLKLVNESRICIGYIKDLTIKNASIDMNGDVGFLADADVNLTVINSDITIKVTEFAISTNKLTLEDCYVASPEGEVVEKDGILHDENGNVIKEIVIKAGEKPTTTDSTTATSSTTTTTTTTSGTGKQSTTTTTASTTASTTKTTSTTASVTGEQSTTTTASTTASTTKATSTTASGTGEQSTTTTTASMTASTTKATSTTAS